MLAARNQFVPFVMLVSLCSVAHVSRAQSAPSHPPTQVTAQQPDSFPLTLEQLPEGPIIVNYQNGQLLIEAQNATLSRVLHAACSQTGTALDISPDAEERVVGVFGPGSAGEVFASLLNGSRFNYVMQGSTLVSQMIVRLTLFVKPAGPANSQPVRPTPQVAKVTETPPPVSEPARQVAQPSAELGPPNRSPLKLLRRIHRR